MSLSKWPAVCISHFTLCSNAGASVFQPYPSADPHCLCYPGTTAKPSVPLAQLLLLANTPETPVDLILGLCAIMLGGEGHCCQPH